MKRLTGTLFKRLPTCLVFVDMTWKIPDTPVAAVYFKRQTDNIALTYSTNLVSVIYTKTARGKHLVY